VTSPPTSRREKRLRALISLCQNLTSQLDPDELLHSIVTGATNLLDSTSGSLILINRQDGVTLDIRVAVGFNETHWENLKLRCGEGITGKVAQTGKPMLIPDVEDEPAYISLDPAIKSELAVPLLSQGRVIGVLNVDSTSKDAFDQDDLELLSALAAQSAVVLQNAGQYQEISHHANTLTSLLEVGRILASSLNPRDILQQLVEQTTQLMKMKMCAIFLVDEDKKELYPETVYGCSLGYIEMDSLKISDSLLGTAVGKKRPILSLNVRTDCRCRDSERAKSEGVHSLLAAPMSYRDDVIGVLAVYCAHPHLFSSQEEAILRTLADLASTVLTNAHLHTRLLEGEEHMMHLEKLSALGEVAAGLAHEIRNPLAVMKMLLHGLLESAGEGSQEAEDLAIIHSKVALIGDSVTQLLELARPLPMQHCPVVLGEIVEESLTLVRHRLSERRIQVESEIESDITVIGDRTRLSQLLLNLILNSCDAMQKGGRITINLHREDRTAYLSIEDTGKGIPPELMPKLFSPFSTSKPGGMGLGLSIAQRIAEEHKGELAPINQPGVGLAMELRLPLV
jgi:signal transduction histidine kinase